MAKCFDWTRPQVLRGAARHFDAARWSLDGLCGAFGDSPINVLELPRLHAPLASGASRVHSTNVRDYVGYLKGGPAPCGRKVTDPLLYWQTQVLHDPPFDMLLEHYEPPPPFSRSEDFLSRWQPLRLLAPPLLRFVFSFRWLFIGPAGSYSRLHVDPVGSAAWNACLQGRKRFVFFPPESMHDLHPDMSDPQSGAHIYPAYVGDAAVLPQHGEELVLEEGDVAYAPPRWPHFVENLTACVSITENFVRCHRDQFRYFDEALASVDDAEAMTVLPAAERRRLRRFRRLVALAVAWDRHSWPT